MTTATAWADYLDARLRLAREWADDGHSPIAIALRLSPGAVEIVRLLDTPTEPPIPGCSRDLARMWRDRAANLQAALDARGAATTTYPPDQPVYSQVRSLTLHEDPGLCGCQYWHERPRAGEHHPHCEYFPKPESG